MAQRWHSCLQCASSALLFPSCAEAGSDSDALQQTLFVAQHIRQQQLKRQVMATKRRTRDPRFQRGQVAVALEGWVHAAGASVQLTNGQRGQKTRSSLSLPTLLWALLC